MKKVKITGTVTVTRQLNNFELEVSNDEFDYLKDQWKKENYGYIDECLKDIISDNTHNILDSAEVEYEGFDLCLENDNAKD